MKKRKEKKRKEKKERGRKKNKKNEDKRKQGKERGNKLYLQTLGTNQRRHWAHREGIKCIINGTGGRTQQGEEVRAVLR